MDAIDFFKKIKETNWDILVTKKWRVKDILSHLVGWTRESNKELLGVFKTGIEPWFMSADDFDDFNEGIYQEFKDYSPEILILDLEKWENELEKNIQEIGENKIRQKPGMGWVFDEGGESHSDHHIKQVVEALALNNKNI